ncbi:FBH1 helicase, partial [Bombycilla garrulus]|nr:FBH1 helicase [Bombycilla garrulus]
CFFLLRRLVSSMAPKVDPGALQILGSHPLFPKAQICVLNKFPDLQSKPGVSFILISGFSNKKRSVPKAWVCLWCLLSPNGFGGNPWSSVFMDFGSSGIKANNWKIHYNIFYCLCLMENASGIVQPVGEGRVDLCSSGQADVKLTHEQQRILNHKIEPGQTVKIMAFAGTGKTSTLVKYAEKFPELRFLYLAFNKAVAEKGKKVFPRNVTCKTFHSLAFGSIGRLYKDKGKLNFSKLTAFSIRFLLQNQTGQSLFVRGKTVSQTLGNFFASSDEEICEEHTPLWFKNTHGQMQLMSQEEKRINVEEAKEIWHNMKKLDGDAEKKYKMTCDGYLKLWQLSKPQLSGYDAIFVDEAQDCTPGSSLMIQTELSSGLGASFSLMIQTALSLDLEQLNGAFTGFRFGPEIAFVASTILEVCKGIHNKTLLGG